MRTPTEMQLAAALAQLLRDYLSDVDFSVNFRDEYADDPHRLPVVCNAVEALASAGVYFTED